MENVTLEAKTRQVGNSLAIFIPGEIKELLGLTTSESVVLHLHKKKMRLSIRGLLAGKKIRFTEEDRLDARY